MEAWIATRAKDLLELAKRAGPYVVLEVVLPGGTLFALLLYLHRTGQLRRFAHRHRIDTIAHVAGETLGALAFALQPAGSEATARREDGLELKLLAAR